jgi:PIN domain nuclease of toxin-antitoxin system
LLSKKFFLPHFHGIPCGSGKLREFVHCFEQQQLLVSAITFWEMALLITKGRMDALRSPAEQRKTILSTGIREMPITGEIAILSVELDGLQGDRADRLIAATSIFHGATLMTADADLLRWPHALQRHDASK